MTRLFEIVSRSDNIVFFGGAGVSTESGIPDFRSSNGIFNKNIGRFLKPEEMVSHSFFKNFTKEFYDFYRNNLIYPDAVPNACHKSLNELEKKGKVSSIITQNIDGLHQLAGSKEVLELHGSVHRNYCEKCGKFYKLDEILKYENVPLCSCGGIIKPDVVLYGESLSESIIRQAIKKISEADTLIVGGTSLVVYPAAGFIRYFRGENLVIINMSRTNFDRMANLVIYEKIGETFESLMSEMNIKI